jgi:hypothetical protein
MARLLVVEALAAGAKTMNACKRVLVQIITVIDQGRAQSKTGREPPPLTAEEPSLNQGRVAVSSCE